MARTLGRYSEERVKHAGGAAQRLSGDDAVGHTSSTFSFVVQSCSVTDILFADGFSFSAEPLGDYLRPDRDSPWRRLQSIDNAPS